MPAMPALMPWTEEWGMIHGQLFHRTLAGPIKGIIAFVSSKHGHLIGWEISFTSLSTVVGTDNRAFKTPEEAMAAADELLGLHYRLIDSKVLVME